MSFVSVAEFQVAPRAIALAFSECARTHFPKVSVRYSFLSSLGEETVLWGKEHLAGTVWSRG